MEKKYWGEACLLASDRLYSLSRPIPTESWMKSRGSFLVGNAGMETTPLRAFECRKAIDRFQYTLASALRQTPMGSMPAFPVPASS